MPDTKKKRKTIKSRIRDWAKNVREWAKGIHPIIRHLLAVLRRFFLYGFGYVFTAAIVIFAFKFVYSAHGVENPLLFSLKTFFELTTSSELSTLFWPIIIERIARDMFILALMGAILVRLLTPAKHIYFSKHFTTNTKPKSVTFRYWILMRPGRFLYDVEIRVLITEPKKNNLGRNKMATLWEWKSDDQHLSLARGDRFIVINEENCEGDHTFQKLENLLNGKNDNTIVVMLRGVDKRGNTFYASQTYKDGNRASDCEFLPIMKSDYLANLTLSDKEKIKARKIPPMRYQYFNKLYKTNCNSELCDTCNKALEPCQIVKLSPFSDMVNRVLSLFLDSWSTKEYTNELSERSSTIPKKTIEKPKGIP